MAYQDPMTPDPREAKLAVWAQDLLKDMRRVVKEARKDADDARLATDPFESNMIMDAYAPIPIGLGKRAKVKVVLSRRSDGDALDYVDVRVTDDGAGIELMGSATLNIRPQVTNVVQVRPDPR